MEELDCKLSGPWQTSPTRAQTHSQVPTFNFRKHFPPQRRKIIHAGTHCQLVWWVNMHIFPLYSCCWNLKRKSPGTSVKYRTLYCSTWPTSWGPLQYPVPQYYCTHYPVLYFPIRWPENSSCLKSALFSMGPSFPLGALLLMRLWIICLQPACTQQCIATTPQL